MIHISIFRAAFSGSEQVERLVSERLQLSLLETELLRETARRYDMDSDKAARAMIGPPFVFNRVTRRRELTLARFRKVLSELIRKEACIVNGFAAHLISKELKRLLRVCILDDPELRARAAADSRGVSLKQARASVREADERAAEWTDYLYGVSPWDRTLYDLKIPAISLGVERAADMIVEAAGKLDAISPMTHESALADFARAQDAALALAEAGHFHAVSCNGSELTVTVNEYAAFFDRLEREIREIAQRAVGDVSVRVIAGPRFRPPTLFSENDFSLPKKLLLVDDEKDFVLTLSERLEMRDAAPSVAFSGEEALLMTAEEAPDVMILDLKMPGIDGIAVLEQVKKEHPAVEVIILTGHGSEEDRRKCLALGAFDYLEKPVDIDVLADALHRAKEAVSFNRDSDF